MVLRGVWSMRTYQKEKKSLTSFSLVEELMFLTLTTDMIIFVDLFLRKFGSSSGYL